MPASCNAAMPESGRFWRLEMTSTPTDSRVTSPRSRSCVPCASTLTRWGCVRDALCAHLAEDLDVVDCGIAADALRGRSPNAAHAPIRLPSSRLRARASLLPRPRGVDVTTGKCTAGLRDKD